MKKRVVVLALFLIALLASFYILIPNIIIIDKSAILNNNLQSLYRCFSESKNWNKWWPGKAADDQFIFEDNNYTFNSITTSSVFIKISSTSGSIASSINFIPVAIDSVKLEWYAKVPTSYNPIKRFQIFLAAKNTETQIDILLKKMRSFGASTANLYGIDIRREQVNDSALVTTFDSSKGYPSVEKIYSLIDKLRAYINSQQALATDSPMLNIFTKDSIYYLTKVAIPTSRRLPSSGKIEYRWMLPGGNILVADIKGDLKKIKEGFTVMENYVHDHQLTAPAIPFYSLITNRLAEKDSTKWVTRIYYPIMYYYD